MDEQSGVEVIIRKKSPFSTGASAVGVPKVSSKGVKYFILLVIVLVIGFGVYKGFPAVTSFVATLGGTEFHYTVLATATETFTDESLEDITYTEVSGTKTVVIESETTVKLFIYYGDDLKEKSSFLASKGDSVKLVFEYFEGGGSYTVHKNGIKACSLCSDLRSDIKGVQLQYEVIIEQNVERTASQKGESKISKNGKERQIVEVTAMPEAASGGELSEVTYEVTIGNPNVQGIVRDRWLYVSYVEDVEEVAEGGEATGEGGEATGEGEEEA